MTYCTNRLVGRRLNSGSCIVAKRVDLWPNKNKPVTEHRFGGSICTAILGYAQYSYRRGGLTLSYLHAIIQFIYGQLVTPLLPASVRALVKQPTGRTHEPIEQIQALPTCNLVRGHQPVRQQCRSDPHRRFWGPADHCYRAVQAEYPNRKQSFAHMNTYNEPGTLTTAYGARYVQTIGSTEGGRSSGGTGSGRGAPHNSGAKAP